MPKNVSIPAPAPAPVLAANEVPPAAPPVLNRMLTRERVWVRNVGSQPIRHAEGTAAPGARFQLHEHEVSAYGAHVARE